MDSKQIKALECLNELERYAKEHKLSIRIFDTIDECKKQIIAENPNWNELNFAVEDLFKSIERKIAPACVETDKNAISIQEVRTKVTKMAERCHVENEASLESMTERKNTVIRKLYGDMQEISHTKAHLAELKNEDLYITFFQKIKAEYERNIFQITREMIGDISNNYSHMLEHMRSMLQSISGYAAGIGNEKFYYVYEERKDGIDKKIQGEAELAEIGGKDILSFGQRTKDTIKNIVKRSNRKRKLLMWFPLLILLICFSFKAVTTQIQSQEIIESAEEKVVDNEENTEVKDFITDVGKKIGEKAISSVTLKSLGNFLYSIASFAAALMVSLGAVLVFFVLLIIVLYAVYLKAIRLWCNRQICKMCAEYLKTEVIQFEQNNSLMLQVEETMQNAVAEYERQYLNILNQLFSDTNYNLNNADNKETNQFTMLKENWNALKYE